MKKVFSLEIDHKDDPLHVELTQKLTLDQAKPTRGLAGRYGLYGSQEWWQNLKNGVLPQKIYEGVIVDIYFCGMHNESKSFTMKLDSGQDYTYTCVTNRRRNSKYYQIGRRARVITFIEKLKNGCEHEFVWEIEIETT